MKVGAREIAMVSIHFLLLVVAFAGYAQSTMPGSQQDAAQTSSAPDSAAQPSPAPARASSSSSTASEDWPKGEVFLGYSYVRMMTDTRTPFGIRTEHFDFIPGGVGEIVGNINRRIGIVADFGGYILHDVGGVDGKLYTYIFGPRFNLSRGRFTPFINVLAGGSRVESHLPAGFVGDTAFFSSSFHKNAFAAAAGGGLDINASRHVAIRLFQIEYLFTKFSDGNNNQQANVRGSAGLVFRFKYPEAAAPPRRPAAHPPTIACTANPTTVHAETDEAAAIHADTTNPDNVALTYSWTATGGSVDGTGPDVRWSPGKIAPGSYTVTGRVDDGRGNVANCTVEVRVEPRPNRPPTMSCAAASTTVPAGQSVQITATASDPDNDPLTYTWQSSGGHVTGTGAQVQFDSTGAAPGHYTVTGQVSDGRGGLADCKVDIEVQKPPEQVQLERKLALHSVFFPTARPTVQNPTGGLLASQQQTLLQLATDFNNYLKYTPDARLILRGHADPRGSVAYNQALSERRVNSVKNFLVQHGVPAAAIDTEAVGEEQPLSEVDVSRMVQRDPNLTAAQKARIGRNIKTVVLAQNRRVDILLKTAQGTTTVSAQEYPFSAPDVLTLIAPKGPVKTAPGARKKAPKPAPTPSPKKP